MKQRNLKTIQALLLCLGYNNGGKLHADGDWGENSTAAAQAYVDAQGIDVPDGQNLQDVLLEKFQSPDFTFDLSAASKDDLVAKQAYMIALGFDNGGQLNADGVEGANTEAASLQYATEYNLSVVSVVAADADDKSARGISFKPVFQAAESIGESATA